jgi:hypothetical protein
MMAQSSDFCPWCGEDLEGQGGLEAHLSEPCEPYRVETTQTKNWESGCADTAAHQAHMALNGECPWCGTVNLSEVRDISVEEAEVMFG